VICVNQNYVICHLWKWVKKDSKCF